MIESDFEDEADGISGHEGSEFKRRAILSRAKAKRNFRLTERDIDLFGFLLDQKFASLEQLYFRFFDVRGSSANPLPNNLFTTRQRLQILRRHDLIKTERVYNDPKSMYLLTHQGYQVFQAKRPHDAYATAVKDVDFRNFEHDMAVNTCRIAIEKTGKVMKWISERQLRMRGLASEFSHHKLPKEIVPDGLFVSSKGERIAFEIETTPRVRRRYQDKKEAYQSVMRGHDPLINRIFWVGATDRIMSDLQLVVQRAPGFVVESYSHFQSKLWPTGTFKLESGS